MSPVPVDEFYVWVHTWWGRRFDVPVFESINGSDIKEWWEHRQPRTQDRDSFYLSVLRKFIASDKRFMLRLEDDVIVNRYIMHNTSTWEAINDKLFGIGFLSTSERMHKVLRPTSCKYANTLYYNKIGNHFGGGWIVERSALESVMPDVEAILQAVKDSGGFGPTTSVADAMCRTGHRCFLHDPALVKIDLSIPSHRFGTATNRYGEQPFDPEFRR